MAACPLNKRSLYHYSIRLVPASVNVIRSFFLRRIYSYDFLPLRFRFILSTYQLSDNGYTHKLRHDRTSSFSLWVLVFYFFFLFLDVCTSMANTILHSIQTYEFLVSIVIMRRFFPFKTSICFFFFALFVFVCVCFHFLSKTIKQGAWCHAFNMLNWICARSSFVVLLLMLCVCFFFFISLFLCTHWRA